MTGSLKVIVSCGGTGGHMFPGLATADTLRRHGHAVTLWTGGKRIEEATRRAWDGPIDVIPAEGISASPWRLPRSLWVLARVYTECCRLLRRRRPDVMLAMGSYSSVGPVLAARRLGIPVVLHEANVIPGRAIDRLARFAKAVAMSFEETRAYLRHPALELTGIPLRRDLACAAPGSAEPDGFTVLVMGGSQGAQRLNQLIPEALILLAGSGTRVNVIHLAGERDRQAVAAVYARAGLPHTVHGFLADMASAYRAASVAVCRSGAASCAELALFGIPAVLIPYPQAARDHQRANARAMEKAGAAVLMDQEGLTPADLADWLREFAARPERRAAMRAAARERAMPQAGEKLANLVERTVASR